MKTELPIKEMLVPTVGRALKHIHILSSKRLSQTGLTLKQFIILEHVKDCLLPQCELALITHRDKGSLTRLLQSLERKKFIRRTVSDHDKRVNLVEATDAGRAVLSTAYPIMMGTFDELTMDLSKIEVEAVRSTMIKLMSKAIALTDEDNCNHND